MYDIITMEKGKPHKNLSGIIGHYMLCEGAKALEKVSHTSTRNPLLKNVDYL